MKTQIRNFFGLALLLAAVSASAQITTTVQVKIPFPFEVAGTTLPAADYKVDITRSNGLVSFHSFGGTVVMQLTRADYRPLKADKYYLQFQRYGDRWVLKELSMGGSAQVPIQGKSERELAKLQPSAQQTLIASSVAHR
jgi:hypothetical protein